jgi:alanine racemase
MTKVLSLISHRRCWVEVDGRALRHNFKILRSLVPRATRLMAVVKANAYGHGLIPMARELEAIGTDWLGVANVAEGVAIREAGVRLPILLLSATLPEEMEEAVRQKLTLTLSSYHEAKRLDRIARALRRKAEIHFKIDTGMGRLGCWHPNARRELARIRRLAGLNVKGLCTHFASADHDIGLTHAQWKAISPFFAENNDLLRHAANSPAVTRRYGFDADMVRVGLALYGIAPNPDDQGLGLRPVLTWKSRVTLLHEMARGRTVSYGATYRVASPQRHAVVAMGYGDGYFRLHSNASHMLVRGKRCPIRGRVTMDQIMIDVTRVTGCRVGDEVVALGSQGGEEILARELALQAQTIPWEILTNIGARVPRIYKHFKTCSGGL